ncbi:polysaccharide pyruvyl transferase family protein [Ruminococcus sp. XPD3002]|uniref:polysaccharide pyruvyl transferase family protein n=1 Tax=Ruminococcus sp. XPD3002 TaxID=1452269 RepID=UPI000914D898|nr:Polysaccharide pyruvyl transferase [Ruminococcus flavefaciens]
MKKIGIITFHSAYNYGSVLQAFATQETVRALGYVPEIINYRLAEQRRVYANLRFKYGVKELIKDLTLLPMYRKRNQKYAAFEDFFAKHLFLTQEVAGVEETLALMQQYETAISGSDQIWNKHSLELEANSWDFMKPYLLADFAGKKVSYASSTANMSHEELEKIKPYLDKFAHIAMRESSSAAVISIMLGRAVESVLDPTFLLDRTAWIKALSLKDEPSNNIVYYSLGGLKRFNVIRPVLNELAKREKCKVIVITPFCYVGGNRVFEPHPEYGPVDFLQALRNAKMVVTDSYHGTILSVNLGKDVYSLCKKGGSEFRKTDILKAVGLEERVIYEPQKLVEVRMTPIDYNVVQAYIEQHREQSIAYLKHALEG